MIMIAAIGVILFLNNKTCEWPENKSKEQERLVNKAMLISPE